MIFFFCWRCFDPPPLDPLQPPHLSNPSPSWRAMPTPTTQLIPLLPRKTLHWHLVLDLRKSSFSLYLSGPQAQPPFFLHVISLDVFSLAFVLRGVHCCFLLPGPYSRPGSTFPIWLVPFQQWGLSRASFSSSFFTFFCGPVPKLHRFGPLPVFLTQPWGRLAGFPRHALRRSRHDCFLSLGVSF